MKKIISIILLGFLFYSCKKAAAAGEDYQVPAPIPVHIDGKNVLLLDFDGIAATNRFAWYFISDTTRFLPSGFPDAERKNIIDSVQRELERNGANILVTQDESLYNAAPGVKERFVVSETDYTSVMYSLTPSLPAGMSRFKALLDPTMEIAGFIYSRIAIIPNGSTRLYNWPLLAAMILHEYGHTAGLLHCPNNESDWMYPNTIVKPHRYFGTNTIDENGNPVNEQLLISNSVPK